MDNNENNKSNLKGNNTKKIIIILIIILILGLGSIGYIVVFNPDIDFSTLLGDSASESKLIFKRTNNDNYVELGNNMKGSKYITDINTYVNNIAITDKYIYLSNAVFNWKSKDAVIKNDKVDEATVEKMTKTKIYRLSKSNSNNDFKLMYLKNAGSGRSFDVVDNGGKLKKSSGNYEVVDKLYIGNYGFLDSDLVRESSGYASYYGGSKGFSYINFKENDGPLVPKAILLDNSSKNYSYSNAVSLSEFKDKAGNYNREKYYQKINSLSNNSKTDSLFITINENNSRIAIMSGNYSNNNIYIHSLSKMKNENTDSLIRKIDFSKALKENNIIGSRKSIEMYGDYIYILYSSVSRYKNNNAYGKKTYILKYNVKGEYVDTYVINLSKMYVLGNDDNKYIYLDANGISIDKYGQIYLSIIKKSMNTSFKSDIIKITNTKEEKVKVESIQFSSDNANYMAGNQYYLNPTINPKNATNKKVIFKSSNEDIVTINSYGIVTAKKKGNATITVTTNDGNKTAKVNITVSLLENLSNLTDETFKYTPYLSQYESVRNSSGLQSFAQTPDNKYVYIGQASSKYTGSTITRIPINKDGTLNTNNSKCITIGLGTEKDGVASNLPLGHLNNIDIERTNNINYLWAACNDDKDTCRIQLTDNLDKAFDSAPNYSQKECLQVNLKKYKYKVFTGVKSTIGISVDSKNRLLVRKVGASLTTEEKNKGINTKSKFIIYNLDSFIENGIETSKISSFTVSYKNFLHRQGVDISDGYIYDVDGGPTSEAKSKNDYDYGTYVSIYSLDGKTVLKRYKIGYPPVTKNTRSQWEPENIKIINGKIYVGFSNNDLTNEGKNTNRAITIYKIN